MQKQEVKRYLYNRQVWPQSTKQSRSKANRVLPRECTGHSKHPHPSCLLRWQSRRTCAHLLGELQNYNSLLNNHRQENVGSHQKRYPMSKGRGEAQVRQQEGQNCIQNQTPYPPEGLRGLKQTLYVPGPRYPTETEIELCLSISCGGMGQQWTATGTGAPSSRLGYGISPLEEVAINLTIELPSR